jgi:nucleoside phosphorylase
MFVEQLLGELAKQAPDIARIVASVLRAQGDEIGDEVGERVHEMLGEYSGESRQAFARMPVDILILTIKDVELTACLRAFGIAAGVTPIPIGDSDEVWVVDYDGYRYGIAMVGTAGNVESGILMGRLWAWVDFKAAALVGMAAGVRGETELGDVIIAEHICAYEFQKMTPKGPVYMPNFYAPPWKRIRRTRLIEQVDPGWKTRLCHEVLECPDFTGIDKREPVKLTDEWRPDVKTGVVLAGSKLIENGSLPSLRETVHGRALAAEMEGAGFAALCSEEEIAWVVVRGIADYGEPKRRKSWQFPATYAAAAFLRDAISSKRLQLLVRR